MCIRMKNEQIIHLVFASFTLGSERFKIQYVKVKQKNNNALFVHAIILSLLFRVN